MSLTVHNCSCGVHKAFREFPSYKLLSLNVYSVPEVFFKIGVEKVSSVHLEVFDLQGKRLWQKSRVNLPKGFHTLRWQSPHQKNGLYLVIAARGDEVLMRKFYLMH